MISWLGPGRGDHRGIGAEAVGEPEHALDPRVARRHEPAVEPVGRGRRHAALVRVDADHAAAVGLEELHGELAEDAQPHDDDRLAQRGRGASHALQRDRAQRHRRGVLDGDALGHLHREVHGHVDQFRVVRDARARARDAVAHGEALDALAHGHHAPGGRVTRGLPGREHAADHLGGARDAVGARHLDRLEDVGGLPERAPVERHRAFRQARRLGARADARGLDPHQEVARADARGRHLGHHRAPALEEHLLQRQNPRVSITALPSRSFRSTEENARWFTSSTTISASRMAVSASTSVTFARPASEAGSVSM